MSKYYEDLEITCKDCRSVFTFKYYEQRYYENKGYKFPRRCPYCREKLYGKKPLILYRVNCRKCGDEAILPFSPIDYKTILCEECYLLNKTR